MRLPGKSRKAEPEGPKIGHRGREELKLLARGTRRLSLFSPRLALIFARATWRMSPYLRTSELAQWSRCALRLARTDGEIAAEVFTCCPPSIVRASPRLRSRFLAVTSRLGYRSSSSGAPRNQVGAAISILSRWEEQELAAAIFDAALAISRSSVNDAGRFLTRAWEAMTSGGVALPTRRALLSDVLRLMGRLSARTAVELFDAVVSFVMTVEPFDLGDLTAGIRNWLTEQTEMRIAFGEEDAVALLLCGLEILRTGDRAPIERLAEVWGRLALAPASAFSRFLRRAPQTTRALLAHRRIQDGAAILAAVFDSTIAVSERSPRAAVECYLTSPSLLEKLSLPGYRAWVERGLRSPSDAETLAAYFAAETRSSRSEIDRGASALHLTDVETVLERYVRMLTGKALRIVPKPRDDELVVPVSQEVIALPASITEPQDAQGRFALYKAIASMAAGQIEFGTDRRDTDEARSFAEELRRRFPAASPKAAATSWRDLIAAFPDSTLARRLFLVLENARIENLLRQSYRGLRGDLDLLRAARRSGRPPDQYLIPHEPLLERLFAIALADTTQGALAEGSERERAWDCKVRELLTTRVCSPPSSVFDTLRACLELYENLKPEPPEHAAPWQDPDARPDQPTRVDQGRSAPGAHDSEPPPGTLERAHELSLVVSDSAQLVPSERGAPTGTGEAVGMGQCPPAAFHYDEWDCRIGDYRVDWCCVTEHEWSSYDAAFGPRTREAYRGVRARIRYQFQLLRPLGLRRVHQQLEGEDLDLDPLVDLIVSRRTRHSPPEAVYTRRSRSERSVAACFLVDMSHSTRQITAAGKTVLTAEKEALVLMGDALAAIGDPYAVYGFSSDGRERVSLYRFKSFDEPASERIERRIGDAIGLGNTRLGAAIRHAGWRLERQPFAIRLLIVLSDAQPLDDDGYDEQYAREDTRIALAELRSRGMVPFCIAFNQKPSAELDRILGGPRCAFVERVETLPERIADVYRRLTT